MGLTIEDGLEPIGTEQEVTTEEKGGLLSAIKSKMKKAIPLEQPLTAQFAYYKTKYGDITSPEEYVKIVQKYIKKLIKSKMYPRTAPSTTGDELFFHSYYCVVDLDNDLKKYVNQIFQPFVEGGFKIINLGERIDEVKHGLVFLISWDHRYDD